MKRKGLLGMLLLVSVMLLVGVLTDFISPTPFVMDEPAFTAGEIMTLGTVPPVQLTTDVAAVPSSGLVVDSYLLIGTSMLVLVLVLYPTAVRQHHKSRRSASQNVWSERVRYPLRCILPA